MSPKLAPAVAAPAASAVAAAAAAAAAPLPAPEAPPVAPTEADFPRPAAGSSAPPSVVGRLAARWAAWAARGAPAQVVEWVRGGFPITPLDPGALERAATEGRMCWTARDPAWVDGEVARLVATGAVREVATRPQVVSPLLLAPKAGPKKWRLVIDMRGLNSALPQRAAKAERLADLLRLAGRGWWAVTWDLEAGYHHVDVAPASRGLLGFGWRGRWFTWQVLPFGLSLSPWAFVKVVRAAVAHWRRQGLRVWAYMDDFALLSPSREAALEARALLEAELEALGWVRAPGKGSWEPTQRFTVLGMCVDLALGRVCAVPEKAAAVAAACAGLARRSAPPLRDVASVAGRLTALDACWPLARLLARPLLSAVAAALPPGAPALWTWDGRAEPERLRLLARDVRAAYRLRLSLSAEALAALLEAAHALATPTDLWRPAWTPPGMRHLYTDASTTGWGAVLLDGSDGPTTVGGPWPSSLATTTPGVINALELRAVALALEALAVPLAGTTVCLHVDSRVALAALRKGSRATHLHALATAAWRRAATLAVRLAGLGWVASGDNPADAPSRAWQSVAPRASPPSAPHPTLDDWGLTAACYARLATLWGPCTVDAFSSPATALLPRYWTRWPSRGAEAADAFAQRWAGERLLLVPPFRVLHRTLAYLADQAAVATLVVPEWPAQPWWPRLLEVATAWTPLSPADFRLQDGYAEPLAKPGWRLWAVCVDGRRARSAAWA